MKVDDLTKEEKMHFDYHFTRCEFDDECSFCDNPTNGSYALGYDNYNGEVDDYICGTCAIKSLPERMKADKEEYEQMEAYMNKWDKENREIVGKRHAEGGLPL